MYNVRFICLLIFFAGIVNVFAQDQTVGLFFNDSRSFNGYTLFNPMRSTTTYLIDNCGHAVNSWTSSYQPDLSVYLLEDGSLLRTCRVGTVPDLGGRLEIFDWDGNMTWSYNFDSEYFSMHHDIEPMPNGNILLISYDVYTPYQATLAGRDPSLIDEEVWAEKIIEIEPVGTNSMNVVWEWKAWDHLVQEFDPLMANYGTVADHPELLNLNYSASLGSSANTDWIHANAIAYNPDIDQILLCSRNLSEILIIDHSTSTAEAAGHAGGLYGKGGDLLYRFGNPLAYNRGTANDRMLFFQHDAEWIPAGYPDEGKITLFNNQTSSTTSSIVIIDPPIDSGGYYSDPGLSFYGPVDFAWSFESAEIYASNLSGAQQLPNGNMLICSGTNGRIYEVDLDGDFLWKYINPVGNGGAVNQGDVPVNSNFFKGKRFAPDFAGFIGHDLIAGDPIELNPWPGDCQVLEDTLARFDLKVYLQGPYNGVSMSHELSDYDAIPFSQPYNISPWNYKGTENVSSLPETNIVDWILVEFRDAENPGSAVSATTICKQAGFLLSDGSVVGSDGISNLELYNTILNDIYVVIWHRNHLGVLSATPVVGINELLTFDFTIGEGQVYNNSLGYTELSTGIWGMVAGDSNRDMLIDDIDIDDNWKLKAGLKGYLPADFNLDQQVNNKEKNDLWYFNRIKVGQVPY